MRRVSLRLAWLVTAAAAVVLDDTTIRDAVTAWLADATAAEATYGHISAWDTSQVTDMKQLFQNSIFNDAARGTERCDQCSPRSKTLSNSTSRSTTGKYPG